MSDAWIEGWKEGGVYQWTNEWMNEWTRKGIKSSDPVSQAARPFFPTFCRIFLFPLRKVMLRFQFTLHRAIYKQLFYYKFETRYYIYFFFVAWNIVSIFFEKMRAWFLDVAEKPQILCDRHVLQGQDTVRGLLIVHNVQAPPLALFLLVGRLLSHCHSQGHFPSLVSRWDRLSHRDHKPQDSPSACKNRKHTWAENEALHSYSVWEMERGSVSGKKVRKEAVARDMKKWQTQAIAAQKTFKASQRREGRRSRCSVNGPS